MLTLIDGGGGGGGDGDFLDEMGGMSNALIGQDTSANAHQVSIVTSGRQ